MKGHIVVAGEYTSIEHGKLLFRAIVQMPGAQIWRNTVYMKEWEQFLILIDLDMYTFGIVVYVPYLCAGLATHEPNFTIIREEFKPNQPRACELCGQYGKNLTSYIHRHPVKLWNIFCWQTPKRSLGWFKNCALLGGEF